MSIQDQERARAIQLLHRLIDQSPSDSRSRARLLSLLHANGTQGQFVFEAKKYKECCDLRFDANWARICDMGLELDPDNSLFLVSGTPSAAKKPDDPVDRCHSAPDAVWDENDRRCGFERRKQDRRTSFTAWYGTENRDFSRRQKYRRQADVETRKMR